MSATATRYICSYFIYLEAAFPNYISQIPFRRETAPSPKLYSTVHRTKFELFILLSSESLPHSLLLFPYQLFIYFATPHKHYFFSCFITYTARGTSLLSSVQTVSRTKMLPTRWVSGTLSRNQHDPHLNLTTHLYIVPRLTMHGHAHPLSGITLWWGIFTELSLSWAALGRNPYRHSTWGVLVAFLYFCKQVSAFHTRAYSALIVITPFY